MFVDSGSSESNRLVGLVDVEEAVDNLVHDAGALCSVGYLDHRHDHPVPLCFGSGVAIS
jgi:hypothetical protein